MVRQELAADREPPDCAWEGLSVVKGDNGGMRVARVDEEEGRDGKVVSFVVG